MGTYGVQHVPIHVKAEQKGTENQCNRKYQRGMSEISILIPLYGRALKAMCTARWREGILLERMTVPEFVSETLSPALVSVCFLAAGYCP